MCERQITVPDNSLLYCSESCRRKDSHKPLLASVPSTAAMSYSSSPPTSPPMSPRIIVAPRIPTRVPTKSTAAIRIPTELQDSRVDQDPSEWKPVIPATPGFSTTGSLASSEAWNYLSQFHGQESSSPNRRYGAGHRSSSSLSTLMSATAPLPSLIHTPSTTASSVSSNASDYMSYAYEASYRPLPPRHNPYFSSGAAATKGVELVVPHVVTPAGAVTAVDMSDSGSIFPASSSLWNEAATAKVSTVMERKAPSTLDLPMSLRDPSKGMRSGS
ncbi:uncharacterized protein ACLA_089060 [Aspergillus clavatus NRRL 1]|uniref:Uncharacterized protein n=1 Tax=Aspergillus clavatus (strain ATCC 1007 / CBS 513.65 / DSM 816 / NCTC 3887 / NRRL 1 / QM 1276 / 107) TaxID=344612 RepID=A1CEB5_ASPCL|nr:uncharacterized protein ACLA_089060 [Aspergillus clavatus NRRL 1]EAW11214.1 conserved hypothetical protein [Aspergillus clavatus NRRL 1]